MALAKCLLSKRSRDCQCQGGCECMEAWCGKRQRPLSRDKGIRHWTAWRSGLGACARARCIHAFTCSRIVVVWLETMPCELEVRRVDQTNAIGEFVDGRHGARRRLSLFPVLLWGDHLESALDFMKPQRTLYCTEGNSQCEIAALAVPSSIWYCSEIFLCKLLNSMGKEARMSLLRYNRRAVLGADSLWSSLFAYLHEPHEYHTVPDSHPRRE
jgi:hypothetical protein